MKYIIVLVREENGRPYVYHSDNKFHEDIWFVRGCKLVEYKTLKRAKEVALKCSRTQKYGNCYAMTQDMYDELRGALMCVYKVSDRLNLINQYLKEKSAL